MAFIRATELLFLFLASVSAQKNGVRQQLNSQRMTNIAESYSNWALGKSKQIHMETPSNYLLTQVQSPPKSSAPIKRFRHHIRIQPPPRLSYYPSATVYPQIFSVTSLPIIPTPSNATDAPFPIQQIPAPVRISELPPESVKQRNFAPRVMHHPPRRMLSINPNFPRLLETEVPVRPFPLFTTNSSTLPTHMSQNFGQSIVTQLLNPLLQAPVTPTPTDQTIAQIHVNPNFPQPNSTPFSPQMPKEEVMKLAAKKQLFGMPRFPMELPHRGFFQSSGMSCMTGWCGNECCEPPRRHFSAATTTIQATALPGSSGPPHPLVLVVHPSPPMIPQCSPACQPQCNEQCIARLQYFHETQFHNHIFEPTCRPDCMPSCHVDCLIIPPQQVRCNSFHCQCLAGYVQCAAFTCCMRYPNLAARMRSNVLTKSSEEASSSEDSAQVNAINEKIMHTPVRKRAQKQKDNIENVTSMSTIRKSFWTKKKTLETTSTEIPTITTTTTAATILLNPCPTTTTTPTSTTTTSTSSPTITTILTTTTTPLTTEQTRPTTTTKPTPSTASSSVLKMTPIYPDMWMKSHKIPTIPAYGMWAIPQVPFEPSTSRMEFDNSLSGAKVSPKEKKNSVGDIRGRHVIRSENFLDVLSELAQVKLKEDITDDFSQAAKFINIMTDSLSKL